MLARQSARRRGFTLIEVTVVSVVIIIIAALTLVAAGPIVKSVRSEAERQLLRSLVVATESFRQRFGALPPLVDESQMLVSVSFQSINNTQ
ncbi:MAG: prepilin-type N-terminal cleavage/methylation domain-containing protein, partial [bacterium]